ncbi:Uncharacterised protein [Vibrio cholerae]|nr:Uncharacterised protein [Vibrio cholerae]CSB85358.1 Uncharacterised protein [Vibrio cholerae]
MGQTCANAFGLFKAFTKFIDDLLNRDQILVDVFCYGALLLSRRSRLNAHIMN